MPPEAEPGPFVSAEVAAGICGCSVEEIGRWRKSVLPRPAGVARSYELFKASEVVAIAAGITAKGWRTRSKTNIDQLVARLALKADDDRDWVVVYESRMGIRVEPTPVALELWGTKKGAVFDPDPYYSAFDQGAAGPEPRDSST